MRPRRLPEALRPIRPSGAGPLFSVRPWLVDMRDPSQPVPLASSPHGRTRNSTDTGTQTDETATPARRLKSGGGRAASLTLCVVVTQLPRNRAGAGYAVDTGIVPITWSEDGETIWSEQSWHGTGVPPYR